MKNKSLRDSIIVSILIIITIFILFLFRYTDSFLLMLAFFCYLFSQGGTFLVVGVKNLKNNKIISLISIVCFLLTAFLFIKVDSVMYYIYTHHQVSNYLKENVAYKEAKIIGIADRNLRGPNYLIRYTYNIKMPDNKIIQGYLYEDTTGPFSNDWIETNYLYHYKDELVSEYNKKYNRNLDIDLRVENKYIIEEMIYDMGSREEILDFVDFVKSKAPDLKYSIRINDLDKGSDTYYSKTIHDNLVWEK